VANETFLERGAIEPSESTSGWTWFYKLSDDDDDNNNNNNNNNLLTASGLSPGGSRYFTFKLSQTY
jgi:hypothetical protein